MKVLHYKSNFLNRSERFIDRLIRNHIKYQPVAMCIDKKHFTDHLPVFQQSQHRISTLINTVCFHLNLSLPFYKKVIASSIIELLDQQMDVEVIRCNARKLIEEEYSVEQLVKDTEKLYSKAVLQITNYY